MATAVRRLLGADIGIATTGEAGPEPEEDVPVGTVYIAVAEVNFCEDPSHGLIGQARRSPELPNWRSPAYAGGQRSTYTEWRLSECDWK